MTSTTTTEITETTEAETTTKTTTFLDNTDYDTDYDKKFKLVTFRLRNYCTTLLKKLSTQNASTIVDYLQALNTEVNPSLSYKANQVKNLTYLSLFCKQKSFVEITRDDILAYLDTIKRPEESDPLHKWIGTYNLRRVNFLRFFKWLYYPTVEPTNNLGDKFC